MIARNDDRGPGLHRLAEHPLPEVADRRRATLEAAGLGTLEALAAADAREVASLPGMHLPLALRTIARASNRLEELGVAPEPAPSVEPEVVEEPRKKEPATLHRRVVEKQLASVIERIRRARRHAAKSKRKKLRKRARAGLQELRDRLDRVRRRVDGGRLTEADWFRIRRVLSAVEHRLDRFLDRRPKRARLDKLRRQIKRASRSLRGERAPAA